MFSLPPLGPTDSYTLWYTSSSSPQSTPHLESSNDPASHHPTQGQNGNPHRRQHANHRTPLARLRLDEEYIERRKQNVQNYGNSWIKPPGIPKSLYQVNEEKREMEEHQEALRREQLAQDLAAAEDPDVTDLGGEDAEGMEAVIDLDDAVPEGEVSGIDAEESDASEDEENEEEDDDVPRGVLASRAPEDVYRETLVRGEQARANLYGGEGGSAVDEEDQSQLLQEEDLIHEYGQMDMEADLDADIPEAGGYEHTDTEDELSSSDDESVDAGQLSRGFPATSMVRSDGTQNSMDLTGLMSQSSSQESSPPQRGGLRDRYS